MKIIMDQTEELSSQLLCYEDIIDNQENIIEELRQERENTNRDMKILEKEIIQLKEDIEFLNECLGTNIEPAVIDDMTI